MALRDFQKTGRSESKGGRFSGGGSKTEEEPREEKRGGKRTPGSRFTGLRSREEGPLILGESEEDLGEHEVEVQLTTERDSEKTGVPYVHATLLVTGSKTIEEGAERKVLFATGGKGGRQGKERLMAFTRAMSGFEDDDTFIQEIENYDVLIGAICGERDCEDAKGPNGKPFGENPLQGCKAYVTVRRGNEKKDKPGEFFYEYTWVPVED